MNVEVDFSGSVAEGGRWIRGTRLDSALPSLFCCQRARRPGCSAAGNPAGYRRIVVQICEKLSAKVRSATGLFHSHGLAVASALHVTNEQVRPCSTSVTDSSITHVMKQRPRLAIDNGRRKLRRDSCWLATSNKV